MIKRVISLMLVITLSLIAFILPCNASEQANFQLTADERDYLASIAGRPLKLGVTSELTSFVDSDGEPAGLLLPLIELMQDEWGLTIQTVHPSWKEGFEQLEDGRIDLLGLCGLSAGRRAKYHCSDMLYLSHLEVFTRSDSPLLSLVNLSDKVVGLTSDSTLVPKLREYLNPNGRVQYFDSIDEMFTALENAEIDCLISAMNLQSELLNHPEAAFELRVESGAAQQGIYAASAENAPLIEILNRYLATAEGEALRQAISSSRTENVYKIATKHYRDDIDYVRENYESISLYDGGVLYPLAFFADGAPEGIQVEVNNIFERLTGVPVDMHLPHEFENGFTTALAEIKSGKVMGACGINYVREYASDPDYTFSKPLAQDTASLFTRREFADRTGYQGLRVGTTAMLADGFIEWEILTGQTPNVYSSRSQLFDALHNGAIDAVFVSEMCVNYYYTVENDFTLRRLGTISLPGNLHMLLSAENDSFNRLMDLSIMLRRIVDPESDSRWFNESRNNQYELFKVQNELNQYHRMIVIISLTMTSLLILALALVWYHLRRFRTYDKQVSTLLSTQRNVDFLWGNLRTGEFKSQGNFPLFRAWGIPLGDKFEHQRLIDDVNNLHDQFSEQQQKDKALRYIVKEREVVTTADGNTHYVRNFYHALGKHEYMIFAQDITAERLRENYLKHVADTDPLSQLLTRRAMEERMHEVMRGMERDNQRLFMYMIDIDNFKTVNDTYGHSIGDKALTSLAQVLRDCLPGSVVSRWGGEEFLVCTAEKDRESAEALGRLLVTTVENTVIPVHTRTNISITISCGLTELLPGELYSDAAVRADDAQYDAKRNGKNRLCVRYPED